MYPEKTVCSLPRRATNIHDKSANCGMCGIVAASGPIEHPVQRLLEHLAAEVHIHHEDAVRSCRSSTSSGWKRHRKKGPVLVGARNFVFSVRTIFPAILLYPARTYVLRHHKGHIEKQYRAACRYAVGVKEVLHSYRR